ncbi:hypothetical protein DPMN_003102 [Dreissena polymorpha]|uniref:Uncharacterized protein n=1 Tax=Dreissena polymorpha TaxID=45954 RepID=A0A9D4MKX4_DREPO|nr:hypothetical protein DPMN_003102 [Dreissena polymorpha]
MFRCEVSSLIPSISGHRDQVSNPAGSSNFVLQRMWQNLNMSGLLVDTDRLVFDQHDDVTRRKTAAYRNYTEVVNAHAVIVTSADNAVRGKLKHAVSSGRCHSRH